MVTINTTTIIIIIIIIILYDHLFLMRTLSQSRW